MPENTVLLRCISCKAVNRVPVAKLGDRPNCGKCGTLLEFSRRAVEVTDRNFKEEVLENPGIVLVFFWATWCAHCRGMIPMIEDLARQKAGMIKVGMVNTEKETYLSRGFNIMSVPRLTLYRYGRIIDELNGAVQKSQFNAWIEAALSRP
jgi:thioredoxin 2